MLPDFSFHDGLKKRKPQMGLAEILYFCTSPKPGSAYN